MACLTPGDHGSGEKKWEGGGRECEMKTDDLIGFSKFHLSGRELKSQPKNKNETRSVKRSSLQKS